MKNFFGKIRQEVLLSFLTVLLFFGKGFTNKVSADFLENGGMMFPSEEETLSISQIILRNTRYIIIFLFLAIPIIGYLFYRKSLKKRELKQLKKNASDENQKENV